MANLEKPTKAIVRKGLPPKEDEASNNLSVVEVEKTPENSIVKVEKAIKEDIRPLNFKVPNAFRKKFKNFATNNDITMSDLLVICFEQYEKTRKT